MTTTQRVRTILEQLRGLLENDGLDGRPKELLREAEIRIGEAAREISETSNLLEKEKLVTGIWYYVYLDPDWTLLTFRTDDHGEGVDHLGVWGTHIVTLLKAHYKLDDRTAGRIRETAYGMPRGRVDRIEPDIHKVGERPGDWMFYHGEDFPTGLTEESEHRKLISAFGLSRLAAKAPDKIRFEPSKHERMVPEEKALLQKLLNLNIPY